jgi:hypothetical protein
MKKWGLRFETNRTAVVFPMEKCYGSCVGEGENQRI